MAEAPARSRRAGWSPRASRDSIYSAGDNGSVAIEFAVILPVFLFILMFMIDVGRYLTVQMVLNNAAQVGARYVALSTDVNNASTRTAATVPDSIVKLATLGDAATAVVSATEWICPLNSENFIRRDLLGQPYAVPDGNCTDLSLPDNSALNCATIGANYRAMERVDLTFKWITPFGLIAALVDPGTDFQNSSIYFNRNQDSTTIVEGKAKLLCQN